MDLPATHQRLLMGAALRTTGAILEFGVGWYSTPLLHEIAEAQKRLCVTYDNNPHWLSQFTALRSDYHVLSEVGWWGELYERLRGSSSRWGLCFVDHGQPIEREYAVRALIERVDVFVLHDTEEGFAYGYDRLLGANRYSGDIPERGLFKYQWTDHSQKTWTTVASRTIDVTQWFKELPPVEQTQEAT